MGYEVRTSVYEGPFDLLLHLILRQEVDLWEVSLSTIVDAYLAELERMDGCDLEVATEFLLIAATLVELKSRRLLPGPADLELDEELLRFEERDLLLARLLECKTFKDVAGVLARRADLACRSIPRRTGPEDHYLELAPDLLAGVGPLELHAAFLRATAPRPVPRVDTAHVAPIRASVADAVAELVEELPLARRITFRALTAGMLARLDVIVHFLALLELFKQGVVELEQASTFGEIHIVWIGAGVERLVAARAGIDDYEG